MYHRLRFRPRWLRRQSRGAIAPPNRSLVLAARHLQSQQQQHVRLLPLLATSLVAATTQCYCEEEPQNTEQPPLDDVEEEDPYENLPEEDEETDCVMCRTFRQGPCGQTWRKLERCFKDNETSKATKCTKYFMGHQQCLSGYLNLYQLISLDLKQELVRDTASAVTDAGERFVLDSAQVDWTPWRSFGKEAGSSFRQSIDNPDGETNAQVPLWKRFPANMEPVLVATEASIPTTISAGDSSSSAQNGDQDCLVLKYAYAVDQDGWTVGLSYHDYYGHLVDQQAAPSSTSDATAANSDTAPSTNVGADEVKDPPPKLLSNFQLEFYIIPGETKTVQFHALYAEDPTKAPSSKKLLDIKLGSSGVHELSEVQQESS